MSNIGEKGATNDHAIRDFKAVISEIRGPKGIRINKKASY